MNEAQKQLLARLREIVDEVPTSGAVNAGNRPLHVHHVARAIEARADDGAALVGYVQAKVRAKQTERYGPLIAAGRPDLTHESIAADPDAPWASEFTDEDRTIAQERLSAMLEAKRQDDEAVEATGVAYDRKIVANLNERRLASGKPELTPAQEQQILGERAAARNASEDN